MFMADKNFKTVMFGYDKAQVDKEIEKLKADMDTLVNDSKSKIKQAQNIAMQANAKVESLQKEMEKIKQKTDAKDASSDVTELQAKIKAIIGKLDPIAKNDMKAALKEKGLPVVISKVTDIAILNQILEVVSQ